MSHGIAWVTPVPAAQPLTGFLHGAAGIAWALLELAVVTGEERFRAAASAARAYERSLFSAEAGNWPDLRQLGPLVRRQNCDDFRFPVAWCHGATGIGLARLRAMRHCHDPRLRAEVHAALQATVNRGSSGNHSLCHGDLGSAELLLQASAALPDPRWRTEVGRHAHAIVESIDRAGWRCGTPGGVESPGLMTGLAGIGYGLLRLADPARVPSVLLLEPPR
jgi:lantibiotic modifying enzyme